MYYKTYTKITFFFRADGWVAETTSLLRMHTGNGIEGSNPSLPATFFYFFPIFSMSFFNFGAIIIWQYDADALFV